MKNFLKIWLVFCVLGSYAFALDIENKILVLEDKISKLKKENELQDSLIKKNAATKNILAKVADKVSKFEFHGKMQSDLANFKGETYGKKYDNKGKATIGVDLDFAYKIQDNLRVDTRLSMVQPFGNDAKKTQYTGESGLAPGDAKATFNRAYVSYNAFSGSTFRTGILPSTNPVETDLMYNRPSQDGLYPIVNMRTTGAELRQNFGSYSIFNDLELWGAVGQINYSDADYVYMTDIAVDDTLMWGTFFETGIAKDFIGQNRLMLGYFKAENMICNPSNVDAPNDVNLGSISWIAVNFSHNKIFSSNLSYNLTYSSSYGDSNGKTVNFGPYTANQNVSLLDGNGYNVTGSIRYDFSESFALASRYSHSSEKFYAMRVATIEDPLNYMNNKGDYVRVSAYYNVNLNMYLYATYERSDCDYKATGWLDNTVKVNDFYAEVVRAGLVVKW